MRYYTGERIIDYISYDTEKYPYPYGDPLVFNYFSSFKPSEHRVICIGCYETQIYDENIVSFVYPFRKDLTYKSVIESLLIVYKDLYGKTYIQIYDTMLKTNFKVNSPKYPTSTGEESTTPKDLVEFEKGFLTLFYSLISYILVRHNIKIDSTFCPNFYDSHHILNVKLNMSTKDCKYMCSFTQDDFIKTYTKEKHDLFEQIYCFLRDIYRFILMIRSDLCSVGRPYRPEREFHYGNHIIYYHNTLAKLKMLKSSNYDTNKILQSLFNNQKNQDL